MTTTTRPAIVQPPWGNLPALPSGGLGPGSSGPAVQAMQQRMIDLHFDPGPADGHFAQDTEYAVIALQKMSNIAPNGHVGPNEWANLQFFKYPTPLEPNGEAKRVEANITKQYLVLYENYQPKLLTTISSGGGERYCFIPLSGGRQVCDLAVTPSGRYTFYTRYTGWQKGDLGTMYNPVYWLRGWAVHGLASVPPYPASHGCIRIPIDIAKYFPSLVNNGDPIYVVGGSATAPSSVSSPLPPPAPTTTAPPVAPTTPVTAPTTTAPVTTTKPTTST